MLEHSAKNQRLLKILFSCKNWIMFSLFNNKSLQSWLYCDPIFAHKSSTGVEIRLYMENQPPGPAYPGSGGKGFEVGAFTRKIFFLCNFVWKRKDYSKVDFFKKV